MPAERVPQAYFLRLRMKCMRDFPVLLLEAVSLFLFLDFSPQLAVDAVLLAFSCGYSICELALSC